MTAHVISFFFFFFNGHTCSPFTLWSQFVNVQLHINIYTFEDKIVKRSVLSVNLGLVYIEKEREKDDC